MTAIPPILVQIQADVANLKAGLAQAQAAIKGVDDNVKVADTGIKNFTSRLKNVAGTIGVAFAGTQVMAFAKDTIMAASNMAESLSKVRVVFGEGAAAVEEWGKTAADSMGISNQAALEAAGTYGNLFQAFGLGQGQAQDMSMSLVQLAGDMASFNNTSIDDAITALRSGLSGETEPLKRFGVAMNEARLKTEALALGLIKSTSDALTPAAKAQAAYALIMKDTALAQGDYARTADGTANTMKTLKAKMEDAKVALGDALMPAFQGLLAVLKVGIPLLQKLGNFFKNNQDEIKAFAIVLGIGATAWGVYTLAVKRAEIAQKLLNLAQKANPIGLIITAVALLAAGMVKLWKNSETFRNIVITVGKAGLTAFASIIPMVGKVYEVIMKVVTGPLRALLTVLSKLPGVGKYAKAGLDIMNKGLDGISDFADKAAAKANSLIKTLDNVGKAKAKAEKDVDTTKKGTKAATPTVDAKTLEKAAKEEAKRVEKLKGYQKDVEDIYKDMNEVIAEAQEKAQEALETRNERMAEAHERYNETVADLNKRYAESIADAEERAAEQRADAQESYRKAENEARKRFAQAQIQIAKQYNDKVADLEKALQTKLTDIRESADAKRADLTQKAAEKQAGIVKQSMDRLRSAFSSKTGFNLGEAMAGGKSADALLADLKNKLAAAKELQANAAALAGMGYSQTFIEQVVKNGPEAGNKIAEALKAASPDATKELQSLYGQVETVSEHGLDALAKTMNQGGKLATSELMEAYTQVASDLRESLTDVDRQMQEGLAEAQAAYASAMTEAKAERDARMTEAMTQMNESIAEAKATLEAALAEAEKTLAKSRAEAQKRLNEGLAEAQKNLQKALEDAQKAYEKAIEEINKATEKKIAELRAKLAEIMALIQAIAAASAALGGGGGGAPSYTPIVPAPFPGGSGRGSGGGGSGGTVAVTQNFTATSVDYQLVNTATVSAIRFGNVIVPTQPTALASRESGAIGAASIASRTTSALSSTQIIANRRQSQGYI